jgi:hypothetical protein
MRNSTQTEELRRGLSLPLGDDLSSIGVDGTPTTCPTTTLHVGGHKHAVLVFGDPERARRLLACWQACDGIPTEALEREGILALRTCAQWIRRLYGTDDPRGLKELQAEVTSLAHILDTLSGRKPLEPKTTEEAA